MAARVSRSGPRRQLARSNGWVEEERDVSPVISKPHPLDSDDVASMAIVKKRLVSAISREQAMQRLSELFLPMLSVRAVLRRRLGYVAKEATCSHGVQRRCSSSSSSQAPSAYTTKQMVTAMRRCDGAFNSNWDTAMLTTLVRGAVVKHYRAGEHVVMAHEPHQSSGLVVLLHGTVEEVHQGKPVRVRRAPAQLCEESVLGEGQSSYAVRVQSTAAAVAVIHSRAVWSTVNMHLQLAKCGASTHPEWWQELVSIAAPARLAALRTMFFPTVLSVLRISTLAACIKDVRKVAELCSLFEVATYYPDEPIPFPYNAATDASNDPRMVVVVRGSAIATIRATAAHDDEASGHREHEAPPPTTVALHCGSVVGEMRLLFDDGATLCTTAVVGLRAASTSFCDVWTLRSSALCRFCSERITPAERDTLLTAALRNRELWLTTMAAVPCIEQNQSSRKRKNSAHINIIALLRQVPTLCHCTESVLCELAARMRGVVVPAQALVVEAGAPVDSLLLLLRGVVERVDASRSGQAYPEALSEMHVRRSPTYLGECCLLSHCWTDSWVASSDVDALAIAAATVHEVLQRGHVEAQALDATHQCLSLYRRQKEGRPCRGGPEPGAYPVEPPAATAPTGRGRRPSAASMATTSAAHPSATHPDTVRALWCGWEDRTNRQHTTATSVVVGKEQWAGPLPSSSPMGCTERAVHWVAGCYDAVVLQDAEEASTLLCCPAPYQATVLGRNGRPRRASGTIFVDSVEPHRGLYRDESNVSTGTAACSSGVPSTVNSFVQTKLIAPPPMIEVLADIASHGRSDMGNEQRPLAVRPTAREDKTEEPPLAIEVASGTWLPAEHTGGTPLKLETTFRPAPPTIERPHTTGTHHSANGVGGANGGGYVRQTVVPSSSVLSASNLLHGTTPLPPSRPITTGSIASTASPSQAATPQRTAEQLHGRLPPPLLSPEQLALETSGLEANRSNKRTDPLTKERTVPTSAQRAVRPFSAQSRGQPSPLSRMVQLSTTSPELSSVQPDSIWGTFLGLDDTGDDDTTQFPFGTISPVEVEGGVGHRPPLPLKSGRSKPIVLLVHVVGCRDLQGCDALVEPVVKVLGIGGRVFMTTPPMRNATCPLWTIEEASFITVLLRRDELTVVVCDNHSDGDNVLYSATMPTLHMESNSGTGLITVPLLNASRQPTRSSMTLRFLATSPAAPGGGAADLAGVANRTGASKLVDVSGTSRHLFGAHDVSRGGPSGCNALVIALADAMMRFPHPTKNMGKHPMQALIKSGCIVAEVVVEGTVVLKTSATATYDEHANTLAMVWTPETASCALECEGGLLEIRLRPTNQRVGGGDEYVGRATFSLDDLVFTGPGMREASLASDDQGTSGSLRLHVVHADTLADASATKASEFPLSLVAVHAYENQHASSTHVSLPWLPDPFVTIRRRPSSNGGAGDEGCEATLLARSSLVFGETHPKWAFHDASCVLAAPRLAPFALSDDSTTIDIALWDNSEANRIGVAALQVAPTMHGRFFVDVDTGGTLTVDITPLSLARIGPATKQPHAGSPITRRPSGDTTPQRYPPVLVVYVSGCSGLSRGTSNSRSLALDDAVDPVVTARFSGERGRHRLIRSTVHYGAADPTWSPTEGTVFSVDLSSCALGSPAIASTVREDDIVFEVWDANETDADLLGTAQVSLRSLVRVGRGVHRFELREKTAAGGAVSSPQHRAIVVETMLTYPNATPVGLTSSGTDVLMAALALVEDEDGSLTEPSSPILADVRAQAEDNDVHRLGRRASRNESFLRRAMPVHIHVCGCSDLPRSDGHPFIVAQRSGTVLSSTPVAIRGDMRHPSWSPSEATTTLMLPVHRGRFEDMNEPLHFVVMWQHGSTVAELGRATVNVAALLNGGGGYLAQGKESEACGADVFLVKTMELRCVPSVRQETKPTLSIVVSHKPK